jgi:hypothetical protein
MSALHGCLLKESMVAPFFAMFIALDFFYLWLGQNLETCARRRRLGWFESGLPWGIEPHDIPIGEQWGG